MRAKQRRFLIAAIAVGMVLVGCNLPKPTPTPSFSATSLGGTLAGLQTSAAVTQTAMGMFATSTFSVAPAIPAATENPSQNPLVTADSLCWAGPGNQYEVVSAIRSGTRPELLGRATIPGWYIVRNPIYHDPCWIPAANVEISPSTDLSALPYFSPPATPTPTPTDTATPTRTATPSPTDTP